MVLLFGTNIIICHIATMINDLTLSSLGRCTCCRHYSQVIRTTLSSTRCSCPFRDRYLLRKPSRISMISAWTKRFVDGFFHHCHVLGTYKS